MSQRFSFLRDTIKKFFCRFPQSGYAQSSSPGIRFSPKWPLPFLKVTFSDKLQEKGFFSFVLFNLLF